MGSCNLTVQAKTKLGCLVKIAMKIAGKGEYEAIQSLYEQSVLREAHKILADPLHILNTEYELLPSGRYRLPMCRYNRFKNSFKILNNEYIF